MHYGSTLPDKYCAFIDILGFRSYVRGMSSSSEGRKRVSAAKKLFDRLEKERMRLEKERAELQSEQTERGTANLTLELTSFSDSIIISGPTEGDDALGSFLWMVTRMATACVIGGFLVRGAVVLGKIYHSGNVAFGPALVEAVTLEAEHAKMPRVILAHSVRQRFSANTTETKFVVSEDGPVCLHMLSVFEDVANRTCQADWDKVYKEDKYIRRRIEHIEKIDIFLRDNLEKARDYPQIYEKYVWFARYFTDYVVKRGNDTAKGWPRLVSYSF
jgi:hypothetical protein